jgi:hypothetical protein
MVAGDDQHPLRRDLEPGRQRFQELHGLRELAGAAADQVDPALLDQVAGDDDGRRPFLGPQQVGEVGQEPVGALPQRLPQAMWTDLEVAFFVEVGRREVQVGDVQES